MIDSKRTLCNYTATVYFGKGYERNIPFKIFSRLLFNHFLALIYFFLNWVFKFQIHKNFFGVVTTAWSTIYIGAICCNERIRCIHFRFHEWFNGNIISLSISFI